MESLQVEYNKINENQLEKFIKESYKKDSVIETKEYGIQYLVSLKDGYYLFEEIRLPITINIKDRLKQIDFFLNKYKIISDLKLLRKKKIIFNNNKNLELEKLTTKKWNLLFYIYFILLKLQVFLLNILYNNENDGDLNIDYLKWCYYLNNLSLKKFRKYNEDKLKEVVNKETLDWGKFNEQYQCIISSEEPKSKLNYFKLLAEQNNFYNNSKKNIGKAVHFTNESSKTQVGIITSIENDSYTIYETTLKKNLNIPKDNVIFINGLANEIYQLENKEIPKTFLTKDNSIIQEIEILYNNCKSNFKEYRELMYYDNDDDIDIYLYNIFFMSMTQGYYLDKDILKVTTSEITVDKLSTTIEGGVNVEDPYLINILSSVNYKLLNLYQNNIEYEGLTYPSLENAFVAQKFPTQKKKFTINGDLGMYSEGEDKGNIKKRKLIGYNAYLVNKLVNKRKDFELDKKEDINEEVIIKKLLIEKFKDNEMKKLLLKTGDKTILYIEDGITQKDIKEKKKDTKIKKIIKKKRNLTCIFDNERNKYYGGNYIGIIMMEIRDNIRKMEGIDTNLPEQKSSIKPNQFTYSLFNININETDINQRPYFIKYQLNQDEYINTLHGNCDIKHIKYKSREIDEINDDVISLTQYKKLSDTVSLQINNDQVINEEKIYNDSIVILLGLSNKHLDKNVEDKNFYNFLKTYSYYKIYPFTIFGYKCKNIINSLIVFSNYNEIKAQNKTDFYIQKLLSGEEIDFVQEINPLFKKKISDIDVNYFNESPLISQIDIKTEILIKTYGNITLENFFLLRLLYAQVIQNDELNDNIENSLETLFIGYNENGYYHLNALMYTRYLLKINKIPNYYNIVKEESLRKKIETTIEIYEYLSQPSDNNSFKTINNAIDFYGQDWISIIKNIFNSKELISHKEIFEKNLKEKQKEEKQKEVTDLEIINEVISISNEDEALNKLDLFLKTKCLTYYSIPKNGDSLFLTICDLLNLNKIIPDNYPIETEKVDNKQVFKRAAIKLREDISDKLEKNKDNTYSQDIIDLDLETSGEIPLEQIFTKIKKKLKLEVDTDYINLVKNSCIDENDAHTIEGIWGGILEIKVISSIFNIDIHFQGIHLTDDEPKIIHNTIKADESRQLFPKGDTYDNKESKEINLIWINNKDNLTYYYSIRNRDNLMQYYIKKDNTEVIRKKYNELSMIRVGKDWKENGEFTSIKQELEENINIDENNYKKIRYFKEGNNINYLGNKIGIYQDNVIGILFD